MKDTKDTKKFNIEVAGAGKQVLIFDEQVDSLICRISFYDVPELTNSDKKEVGAATLEKILSIAENKKSEAESYQWRKRCELFRSAYNIESKNKTKNKISITWLLTSILGISSQEAERRYDTAEELISHPDFKKKEDIIIEKIYFSEKNIASL